MKDYSVPKGWSVSRKNTEYRAYRDAPPVEFFKQIEDSAWYISWDGAYWTVYRRASRSDTCAVRLADGFMNPDSASEWVMDKVRAESANDALPCPYCGSDKLRVQYESSKDAGPVVINHREGCVELRSWRHVYVLCPRCGVRGPVKRFDVESTGRFLTVGDKQRRTKAKKEAVAGWNAMNGAK